MAHAIPYDIMSNNKIKIYCKLLSNCVNNITYAIALIINFRYVRALGATYMRLTGSSLDCYKYLEPLYLDYRKLRRMNKTGGMYVNPKKRLLKSVEDLLSKIIPVKMINVKQ